VCAKNLGHSTPVGALRRAFLALTVDHVYGEKIG